MEVIEELQVQYEPMCSFRVGEQHKFPEKLPIWVNWICFPYWSQFFADAWPKSWMCFCKTSALRLKTSVKKCECLKSGSLSALRRSNAASTCTTVIVLGFSFHCRRLHAQSGSQCSFTLWLWICAWQRRKHGLPGPSLRLLSVLFSEIFLCSKMWWCRKGAQTPLSERSWGKSERQQMVSFSLKIIWSKDFGFVDWIKKVILFAIVQTERHCKPTGASFHCYLNVHSWRNYQWVGQHYIPDPALNERPIPPDGLAQRHVLEFAGRRHVVGVEHVELRRGQVRRQRPPDPGHLPHLQQHRWVSRCSTDWGSGKNTSPRELTPMRVQMLAFQQLPRLWSVKQLTKKLSD